MLSTVLFHDLLLFYTVLIYKKHQETLYIFFGHDV